MVGKGTRLSPLAALMASTVLVSGCAETNLASHFAKKAVGDEPPAASSTSSSMFKVGKPYQVAGIWYYPQESYDYDETGIASWYGPGFHSKLTANGETFDQNSISAAHKTLQLPCIVRVTNLENGRSLVVRVNDRGPFVNGRIIDLSRHAAQLLGMEGRGTARVRVQVMGDESRALADSLRHEGDTKVAAAPRPTVTADPVGPVPSSARPTPVAVRAAPQPSPMERRMEAENRTVAREVGQVSQTPVHPTSIYVQVGSFANYANAERLSAQLAGIGQAQIQPTTVKGRRIYRVRFGPASSVDEADRILDKAVAAGHQDARVVVD